MKVFLDVGSHYGETLNEVLKKEYNFDKVFCFEPSSKALPFLEKEAEKDDRVTICPFGLSNKDDDVKLYNSGTLSGSIFKNELDESDDVAEIINLKDTSKWFTENLSIDDFVVMKTNCEGSEVYIVESLIKSNLIKNIYSLLVTFDIREFKEFMHLERKIRKSLQQTGFNNFCFSEDVMIGSTHDERIKHWLHLFGINEDSNDKNELSKKYKTNFERFSKMSGTAYYIESKFKSYIRFNQLPEFIKKPFRFLKKHLWTYREKNS